MMHRILILTMQVSSDFPVGALLAETQQLPDLASEHRGLCFSNLSLSTGNEIGARDDCILD